MPDHLLTKYIVSMLVIFSISHGDWGDNGCFGRRGYLGIERADTGGRGRKGLEVLGY
jgi:hypothetical protein